MRTITLSVLLCLFSFAFAACGGQANGSPSPVDGPQTSTSGSVSSTSVPYTATTNSSAHNNTPTATTSTSHSKISDAVTNFYHAVELKSYVQAYMYVSANAKRDGQKLTKDAFFQLAQAEDSANGPVNSFSFIADASDPTLIILTLTRKSGLNYHAHLQLQQEGSAWKIVQLDRV